MAARGTARGKAKSAAPDDDALVEQLRAGTPQKRRVAALALGVREPARGRGVLDELAATPRTKTEHRIVDDLRVLLGTDEAVLARVDAGALAVDDVPAHALVRLIASLVEMLGARTSPGANRGSDGARTPARRAAVETIALPISPGSGDPSSRHGIAGEPSDAVRAAQRRLRRAVVAPPHVDAELRARVGLALLDAGEGTGSAERAKDAAAVLAGHAAAPLDDAPVWRAPHEARACSADDACADAREPWSRADVHRALLAASGRSEADVAPVLEALHTPAPDASVDGAARGEVVAPLYRSRAIDLVRERHDADAERDRAMSAVLTELVDSGRYDGRLGGSLHAAWCCGAPIERRFGAS